MMGIFDQRPATILFMDDVDCRTVSTTSTSPYGRLPAPDIAVVNLSSIVVQPEVFPALPRSDRMKLTQRRLAEYFNTATLRYAAAVDAKAVTLVAADLGDDQKEHLSGVRSLYLAPFVLRAVAQKLRLWAPDDWGMLITRHGRMIRYTALRGDQVMLTRQIPEAEHSAQQIVMTLAYLARLGLRDRRSIQIVALGMAESQTELVIFDGTSPPLRNLSWAHISSVLGVGQGGLRDADQLLAYGVRFCTARDRVPAATWAQDVISHLSGNGAWVVMQGAALLAVLSVAVALFLMWPLYRQWQGQERDILTLSMQASPEQGGTPHDITTNDALVWARRNQILFAPVGPEPWADVARLRMLATDRPLWSRLIWQNEAEGQKLRITLHPQQAGQGMAKTIETSLPAYRALPNDQAAPMDIILSSARGMP